MDSILVRGIIKINIIHFHAPTEEKKLIIKKSSTWNSREYIVNPPEMTLNLCWVQRSVEKHGEWKTNHKRKRH